MKFIDFSPSTSPSYDEQQDALQKGLGRAVQWANTDCLSDDSLLNACLTDQRYDVQVEGSRTDWLWQIIKLLQAKDRFRVPILHALHELADQRSACQLCELGVRYAQAGDEAFRTRLYEIVESRPFPDYPLMGDLEVLQLDRIHGFLFVARVRGNELSIRDWDWHDGHLVTEAINLLGEPEVRDQLEQTSDPVIRRFRDRWKQVSPLPNHDFATTHTERLRSLAVSDILAEARKENPSLASFRGWGMQAADADLKGVVARLWEATASTEIICLLRVFANRALPSFDPRLIELCQHSDSDVCRWANNVLAQNTDPAIREYALQRLTMGEQNALRLFINNFKQGDEQVILSGIELPHELFEVHSIICDLIKILERNDDADSSQLGVFAYAKTPCEICRLNAVRHLFQQHAAPDWLFAECRFDSVKECRELGEDRREIVVR